MMKKIGEKKINKKKIANRDGTLNERDYIKFLPNVITKNI